MSVGVRFMARKPKYRRHSTRDLGFAEHAKKRTYFAGPYGSEESREAYREFLRSIGFLVQEPRRENEIAVSLARLTTRFLDWAEAAYPAGRRSHAANLADATNLLIQFAPEAAAVSFTPLRMKAFQKWLIDRGLSRSYINSIVGSVRLLFKWSVSEELVPVGTYQALLTVPGLKRGRSGAKENPPVRPVTWDHVWATLAKLNPTVKAMVQVHWLTGVRSQSLCAARVAQFDFSQSPWLWRPIHKTQNLGHSLVVFVGPSAQKILAPFVKGKLPTDFVFRPANKSGKRSRRYRSFYDPDTYRRAVVRAAAKAKVPHWSPHQLRHARGTLVRERHGLEAAQAALGHARIDATQIYAQKQVALAKMVAETMG